MHVMVSRAMCNPREPFHLGSCLKGKYDLPELIHFDISGPFSSKDRDEYMYFITFIDNFKRLDYVSYDKQVNTL